MFYSNFKSLRMLDQTVKFDFLFSTKLYFWTSFASMAIYYHVLVLILQGCIKLYITLFSSFNFWLYFTLLKHLVLNLMMKALYSIWWVTLYLNFYENQIINHLMVQPKYHIVILCTVTVASAYNSHFHRILSLRSNYLSCLQ